jgi:branched-chain amino acid transport system substrate-binding protein
MAHFPGLRRIFSCFALIAVVVGASAAKADLEIAVVRGFSGTTAPQSIRGIDYFIASINESGGVLGQKLHASYFDDRCDADQAAAAARQALAVHPSLIIGHDCSAASIRGAPIYAAGGVIQISISSTTETLTEMNIRSVFRLIGQNNQQSVAAADLIARHWPTARIGVIDDGSPYGQGLANKLREILAERKIPVVLSHAFTPAAPSYTDIAAEVDHAKIGVLYIGGYSEDIGLLTHDIRAAGLKTQIVAGEAANDGLTRQVAGPALDGLLFTGVHDAMTSPKVRSMVSEARAKSYDLDSLAVVHYAAIQAWVQAVRDTGSVDFDKVTERLHHGRFDTVLGPVEFDENGNVVGARSEWVWYRWHDGRVEPAVIP